MKYLFLLFFLGFSSTAFCSNNSSELVFKKFDVIENVKKLTSNSSKNKIAFECYYTVEWLYTDSPFIKRIQAIA